MLKKLGGKMNLFNIALMILLVAAAPLPVQADMVMDWNNNALQAIRNSSTAPPVASRALAITHAAIFDSVNSISTTYSPYKFNLAGYAGASAEAAVAAAGYNSLLALFPGQAASLTQQYNTSLANIAGTDAAKNLGITLGSTIAADMLALRANDGASAAASYPYTPTPGAGNWQPTPANANYLLPGWGQVTPFAMTSNTQFFEKKDPPAVTSNLYAKAFNEVKSLGAKFNSSRTPDQTEIALFWADGPGTQTPPGHWNSIAQTVAQSKNTTLVENARLFALLNLAEGDAAIAAWNMKLSYDYWRPITAIREGDQDGNRKTVGDPDWEPLINTPPFPSYVSGHSTFSGAAAAILEDIFKDKTAFSTTSDGLPGVERTFERFSEAAAEAGLSRIYGGIHWDFDNELGLKAGDALGDYIFDNFLTPLKTKDLLAANLMAGPLGPLNGGPTAPLPGTLSLALGGLGAMLIAGRRRQSLKK
jgi:hypothetical protein